VLPRFSALTKKKENEKKKKKNKKRRKKKEEKKGEFRAGLYPLGIESRNTTPNAINVLV
jgi:polyferredoxin